jgi:hypothetical protein
MTYFIGNNTNKEAKLELFYKYMLLFDFYDGCPTSMLVEPFAVVREYEFQWVRPSLDLAKLARLRIVEGWTLQRLMRHFGCGQMKLYRELGEISKPPAPNSKSLGP